ncbi:MAG: thiamine phosphate synthase [Halanaerobiaceae bacterium]
MNKISCLNTDIYGITAEKYSCGRSNVEVVRDMLAAGIKIIQYREKEKSMFEKYQECKVIRQLTRDNGVVFIVNDHIDLALAVEADGVHIGQNDLPIEVVRQLVDDDMVIGLSTHSPEQAHDAVQRGADYIGVGPIFNTNTKENVCASVGIDYLKYVAENIDIPFVAIGGIKEHNVLDVKKNGAYCVCLVTEIVGAEDIQAKIRSIRGVIE